MILKTTEQKKGATFALGGYVNLPPGTWSMSSTVRDPAGVLVQDLTVNLVPPVLPETQYSISLAASATDTADWPIGTLDCDIRYTEEAGLVLISPTFNIIVLEAQTNE